MAKPKKASHSGPHKHHGPKRHLFSGLKPLVHEYGRLGVISKYSDRESFNLACYARGQKHIPDWLFSEMYSLDTKSKKDEWFKNLSSRNLIKEDKEKRSKEKSFKATKQPSLVKKN